ncbi:MAG: hypothetical protein V2A70_07465 [Candidatus Omnitrophota bacterium]
MKKYKFLLIILIFIITVPAWAQARGGSSGQGGRDPAVTQALPRWKSSLGEIQQTSSALLEKNSALMRENGQLKHVVDQLRERVEALRVANARVAQELLQGRQRGSRVSSAEVSRLKGAVAQQDLQLAAQQNALEAVRLRRSSCEARLAVLRLQVADIEVVRKAREVGANSRDAARIEAVMKEMQRLTVRAAATVKQTRLLQEKVEELESLKTPDSPQARELMASMDQLRARVVEISKMKADVQAQLSPLEMANQQAGADVRIQRLRQLMGPRDELQMRLQDNIMKINALKAGKPDDFPDELSADEENATKLARENSFITDEVANLHENIALLEYKITTLERYRGRNAPSGKVR